MKKGLIRLWVTGGILCHIFLLQAFCQPEKLIQKLEKKGFPPGTIRIADDLYIDETEISNLAWREQLFFLERDSSMDVFQSMLPDTSIFERGYKITYFHLDSTEGSVTYLDYFEHPIHQLYPVLGVSHEQAVHYCRWRSTLVNQILKELIQKKKKWQKWLGNQELKVVYRLPTAEEWERAAMGELDTTLLPMGYPLDQLEQLRFKENPMGNANYLSQGIPFLEHVYENSPPNSLGLYGMMGNVAEMTDQKGIAKGGAYIHSKFHTRITDTFRYQGPNHWLGFRCVCEWVVE